MNSGFVLAIVVFTAFAAGAVIGMVIAVAVAIYREDKRMSLKGAAPDWLSGGARWVNGVGVRNEGHNTDSQPALR